MSRQRESELEPVVQAWASLGSGETVSMVNKITMVPELKLPYQSGRPGMSRPLCSGHWPCSISYTSGFQ